MSSGTARTKPVDVDYFHIVSSTDMEVALEAAIRLNMRGTIYAGFDRTGAVEWRMEIVDLQGTAVAAKIGDVYIWDTVKLVSMPQADFTVRYDILT